MYQVPNLQSLPCVTVRTLRVVSMAEGWKQVISRVPEGPSSDVAEELLERGWFAAHRAARGKEAWHSHTAPSPIRSTKERSAALVSTIPFQPLASCRNKLWWGWGMHPDRKTKPSSSTIRQPPLLQGSRGSQPAFQPARVASRMPCLTHMLQVLRTMHVMHVKHTRLHQPTRPPCDRDAANIQKRPPGLSRHSIALL